jgi:hypothetical protein
VEEDIKIYGDTMPINDYVEKEIRKKILNKIKPQIQKSKSPHQKGKIYIGEKVEARVKIPNDHSKIMKESKSKYIASALRLSDEEFNDLIDCPITGPKYYKILANRVK